MSDHKDKLKTLCRICGECKAIPVDRQPYRKEQYKTVILKGLSINVEDDDENIHPPYICDTCRRKLDRWSKTAKKGRTTGTPPCTSVAEFSGCSDTCKLCDATSSSNTSSIQEAAKEISGRSGFQNWVGNNGQIIYMQLDTRTLRANRVVIIYSDSRWSLQIYGTNVQRTNPLLIHIPEIIEELHLQNLFRIACLDACIGNPAHDFPQLGNDGKVFTDRQGEKVAEVESSFYMKDEQRLFASTIRHTKCHGLAVPEGVRCQVCRTYRSDLFGKCTKLKFPKIDVGTSSSHTRHDYMSNQEKDTKLKNLRREKININARLHVLEQRVEQLMDNEAIGVEDEQGSALIDIFKGSVDQIDTTLPKDTPMRLLWDQQQKYMNLGDPRQMRWHPTIIRWCIALHAKSPAAYKMLRQSPYLNLPHQTTLFDYTHFTEARAGINPDMLNLLVDEAKLETCPEREKNITVIFDEMKIKAGLVFSQSTGKIVGFTERGGINEEVARFERRVSCDEDPPLATYVLVLMARGLFSKLKHPVAYYPCNGFSSNQLHHVLWEAVDILEHNGFLVRALVSDGASPNRTFYNMHRSQDGPIHCTTNPNDSSRKLYFICDVPHLLKTTRNCFENSGWNSNTRKMRFRGKPILWSHIIDLFEWDIGVQKRSPGLRKLHKLTPEHVYLKPASRMRVYMAAQVLSESVANAMELRNLPETESTIFFIRMMNKFFDCLNVSNLYQGNKGNSNLLPYYSMDDPRLQWLTTDFLSFLDEWEKEGADDPNLTKAEKIRLCLSPQTLQGLRITVYSIVDMAQDLLSLEDVEFLLTEKASQDPLEEVFGDYRGAGGACDNPNSFQLGHIFTAHAVSHSGAVRESTGNCRNKNREEDLNAVMSDMPLNKRKRKRDGNLSN